MVNALGGASSDGGASGGGGAFFCELLANISSRMPSAPLPGSTGGCTDGGAGSEMPGGGEAGVSGIPD